MSELKKIQYECKFDDSLQDAMCRISDSTEARPLLVGLHTWSYTYELGYADYDRICCEKDYHFIFPHFRGPNWTTEACGSDAVVSDLEDAVRYMKKICKVDEKRIYLVGGSGGGHASLLMAGRRPDLFTAISAWCPISDVARWQKESARLGTAYADHILKACSGDPAVSAEACFQARVRSPLTWLSNAAGICSVDVLAGIHDGHNGATVPVGQSIRAYNALAEEEDRISEEDIAFIEETQSVPEHLKNGLTDPAFGPVAVYLRKVSNRVRLTLFEGGHASIPGVAGEWLSRQVKGEEADLAPGTEDVSGRGELTK